MREPIGLREVPIEVVVEVQATRRMQAMQGIARPLHLR
jgi:hypothetical protein